MVKDKAVKKNIELDYFVFMSNHFHGIIILNEYNVETCGGKSLQETKMGACEKPAGKYFCLEKIIEFV